MDDRLLAGGVEGEGGGNSGNARKKTFFFPGCGPLLGQQLFAADLFLNLLSDVQPKVLFVVVIKTKQNNITIRLRHKTTSQS